MAFAGVMMYFIALTTGAAFYVSAPRDIETVSHVAEEFRPLAGDAAYSFWSHEKRGYGKPFQNHFEKAFITFVICEADLNYLQLMALLLGSGTAQKL
jgi:hypothetical protein